MKRLLLLLPLLAPAWSVAGDNLPLPALAPGEATQRYDALAGSSYAPPLALSDGSILAFPLKGGAPAMLRLFPDAPARSQLLTFAHFKVPEKEYGGSTVSAAYSSAVTPAGVWLVGPTVELIRHKAAPLSGRLQWPRHRARVVALDDGSVMVVGGQAWPPTRYAELDRVERIYLDAQGALRSEALPALPALRNAGGEPSVPAEFSLLHLGGNRVLLAGGRYRNTALLYEPGQLAWRELPGMREPRIEPALALLSGGRVWASGSNDDFSPNAAPYTSEIWDPATQAWRPGPALPVPMAGHRAALTPDRKYVLLAGGKVSTVLAWQPGTADVFVAAQPSLSHYRAGLLPLPDNRLALVAGRHARVYGEGWGQRRPTLTIEPLDLARSGDRQPLWPEAQDGAIAVRDGGLVALGGQFLHYHQGSEQHVASRHVERMTLASGRVDSLPPLPVSSQAAEACWLDDTRLLVHVAGVENGPRHWLAVLDSRNGGWRELALPELQPRSVDAERDGLRLLGCAGGEGWLLEVAGRLWRLDVDRPALVPLAPPQRKRQRPVARVLADGRVLVAGGREEEDLVAARIAGCAECPERYIGFGEFAPSRHYEWFDPARQEWTTSAAAAGAGVHAAILGDGRVALLGLSDHREDNGHDAPLRLQLSDAAGRQWRELPLAAALPPLHAEDAGDFDYALKRVTLLAVANEQPGLGRALFLGVGEGQVDWWWLPDVDAPRAAWKKLGTAIAPLRFPRGEIATGMTSPQGLPIFVRGSGDGVVAYTRSAPPVAAPRPASAALTPAPETAPRSAPPAR